MGYQQRSFTLIKGQETTFNLNQIYLRDYEETFDVGYLTYEDNYVVGSMYLGNTPNQIPNWLTITDTENINNLNYSFFLSINLFPESLYNGTDYIKECKIKIDTAGVYTLNLVGFYIKYGNPNRTGRFIGPSWTLNVIEQPEPNVYNNAGIVYNKYDRVIRVENNKTTDVSFGTDGLFPNGEQLIINSTLPAFITNNTINNYTQFWSLSPTSTGTFYYNASAYLRNTFEGAALITVIVVDSLYEEINNCCSDENVNIVWLNRQGGRGNFIFSQRKDFNVEVGKKSTYITNDIKRYSEIKNVHNGFKVYATGISKNQIDFLDTLRYSIQCWQFINGVFVPLILDIGSFEKYNTKENMYEISMNFLYAERLNIQRQ